VYEKPASVPLPPSPFLTGLRLYWGVEFGGLPTFWRGLRRGAGLPFAHYRHPPINFVMDSYARSQGIKLLPLVNIVPTPPPALCVSYCNHPGSFPPFVVSFSPPPLVLSAGVLVACLFFSPAHFFELTSRQSLFFSPLR